MRIIHCADLHIGSKMDSKFTPEQANQRRAELRAAFSRLVEYAEKETINVILISGDAFDSDNPAQKDLDFFYQVIEAHPDVRFYYLRGNHDIDSYLPPKTLSNLFVFSHDEFKAYSIEEGIVIGGIEIDESNKSNYYDKIAFASGNFNILMLHGQVNSEIDLKKLIDKNITYLALGHIHAYSEYSLPDRSAKGIYPGCLEPRGFDEIGEKGFVVLDTATKEVKQVVNNFRTIHREEIDVTGMNLYQIQEAIKGTIRESKDLYRVVLTGELDASMHFSEKDAQSSNASRCFFLEVKDETAPVIDIEELKKESPLIAEFIRQVESDGSLSKEEQIKVIALGIDALKQRRIDE